MMDVFLSEREHGMGYGGFGSPAGYGGHGYGSGGYQGYGGRGRGYGSGRGRGMGARFGSGRFEAFGTVSGAGNYRGGHEGGFAHGGGPAMKPYVGHKRFEKKTFGNKTWNSSNSSNTGDDDFNEYTVFNDFPPDMSKAVNESIAATAAKIAADTLADKKKKLAARKAVIDTDDESPSPSAEQPIVIRDDTPAVETAVASSSKTTRPLRSGARLIASGSALHADSGSAHATRSKKTNAKVSGKGKEKATDGMMGDLGLITVDQDQDVDMDDDLTSLEGSPAPTRTNTLPVEEEDDL
jgi:hypothetical protein